MFMAGRVSTACCRSIADDILAMSEPDMSERPAWCARPRVRRVERADVRAAQRPSRVDIAARQHPRLGWERQPLRRAWSHLGRRPPDAQLPKGGAQRRCVSCAYHALHLMYHEYHVRITYLAQPSSLPTS